MCTLDDVALLLMDTMDTPLDTPTLSHFLCLPVQQWYSTPRGHQYTLPCQRSAPGYVYIPGEKKTLPDTHARHTRTMDLPAFSGLRHLNPLTVGARHVSHLCRTKTQNLGNTHMTTHMTHPPSPPLAACRASRALLACMRSRGHSPRGVVGSMVGVQHGAAAWHKVCCRLCMTLASVTRQGSAMSSRIRVRVEQGGLAIGFGYNCHTSAALGLCVPHACRYCC